ncbi:L-type lectin-domain containing protein [Accumulibacter sp.]|uniref:L-type lectin-domain containing protein n=1 Tax=Accumulibacter sp. TaxID=2053492 RepID=UPI0025D6AD68|nr:L-type lectin-domain containing protein [Accumulibacter sp.]MCM8595550.1 L-type lectin-domain containing protein [Accumulibacter sp.]MDS4049698.1 L-type lectin-domain containing protein [Accumulibacter sp.]
MKTTRMFTPIVAALGLLAGSASATTLIYNDFSSVSGLKLNGNAAQAGNVLRVTPANYNQSGSAFSQTAISLASNVSFSSAFSFRITNSGGSSDGDGLGADGITFTVQTVSNTAGGIGGGIGYAGILNSVAIEYDTWDNGTSFNDPNGNHVGVDLAGDIASVQTAVVGTRMNDGNVWYSWVDYDGTTKNLEVRLSQSSSRPAAAILTGNVDLAAALGTTNAYVGFTSGTGAAFGDHDILSWEFRDTFAPIGNAPEPASLALLGLGLFGLAAARKRQAG